MKKKKVLLIDDIPSVRKDLRAYINPVQHAQDRVAKLLGRGPLSHQVSHIVDEAGQGIEGVALALRSLESGDPYDMIVVDMMMPPGINGLETIRRIRAFDQGAAIVICTGNGVVLTTEATNANGGIMPDVIYKPEVRVIGELVANVAARRNRG